MALTFNAVYYYNSRPDVLEAFLNSDMSVSGHDFALNHFNNFGWSEGYNPNAVFITAEYLAANPDVDAAGVNPFDHYNTYGQAEGRAPNATFPALADFDWETYVDANADLQAAGIDSAAAAYDHYITFGYAEGRPGAPDNADFLLVAAVEGVQAAETALADFLDGLEDNPATLYDETDPAVAFAAAETELATDIGLNGLDSTLAAELVTEQGELAAAITAFNAAADADDEAALARFLQLGTDLVGATEAATAATAAAGDAFDAFEAAQFELGKTAAFDGVVGTVEVDGAVLAQSEFVNGTDATDGIRYVVTIAGTDVDGIAGVVAALNAAEVAGEAAAAVATERTDIATDLAGGAHGALFVAVDTEAGDVAIAQAAIDARQALIDAVADTGATHDQLVILENNVTAAQDAVAALGFDHVLGAGATGAALGTAGETDLIVYVENNIQDNTVITNFGAEDTLIFGSGYSVTKLAATADLNTTADFGNVAALDIFYQQDGANTVIYIEGNTYDGQADFAWAGETVTLVGVNANDISIDGNGMLRIADAIV